MTVFNKKQKEELQQKALANLDQTKEYVPPEIKEPVTPVKEFLGIAKKKVCELRVVIPVDLLVPFVNSPVLTAGRKDVFKLWLLDNGDVYVHPKAPREPFILYRNQIKAIKK